MEINLKKIVSIVSFSENSPFLTLNFLFFLHSSAFFLLFSLFFYIVANADACATSFFGAGSTTTKDVLEWFCLLISSHPSVQERMHSEIVSVIGFNHDPSQQDRSMMPFTEAVLAEVLRFSSSIPINLPHM